jgi:mannose-6-phosphate isomerase-like protein (cupin superfamily)
MTYEGDGEVSAVYRPKDAVEGLQLGPTSARLIARGALTGGRFGLFRWDMTAESGGASPHFHRTFSESFFVLSGSVQLFDGGKWVNATEGDFLHIPEGGIHGFRNESGQAASMLILFAPGAPRERYFEELAAISASGRQLDDEEWTKLLAHYDQYPV